MYVILNLHIYILDISFKKLKGKAAMILQSTVYNLNNKEYNNLDTICSVWLNYV